MSNQKPSFRFEIENFSKKQCTTLTSDTFVCGGCEWYLSVGFYPMDAGWDENYLSVFLEVANPRSLQTGWRRSADFYFVVSTQSGKELFKTVVGRPNFRAENTLWGFQNMLSLWNVKSNLGFRETEKLIIDVYITYVEALAPTEKETVEKNELLKSKLEKISLERKKTNDSDGFGVQQLEERIKNLELVELGRLKSKLEEVSSEMKNLELMVSTLKIELDKKKAKFSADDFLLVDKV